MREQTMLLIKKDEQDRVTAMDSTAYIQDTDGWTGVESMCGEQYRHAMAAFRMPIARPDGVYCYKYVDGVVVERTREEMDADYAARPAPEPTTEELLLETAADHEYRLCLMELGVSEDDL